MLKESEEGRIERYIDREKRDEYGQLWMDQAVIQGSGHEGNTGGMKLPSSLVLNLLDRTMSHSCLAK